MHKLTSLLFASALLVACRGGDSDDPDARPNSDGPPNPDDATIYDIQNPDNRIPAGTTVNVRGVVVTAVDTYGMRVGNFWVQEPGGGPYSGVLVFGGDAAVVQTLQLGDIVDIAGAAKSEFSLDADMSGNKTTELEPGDSGTILITRVSGGTPLEPEPVDALAIARMDDTGTVPTARDSEWEKWEGVLIRIENVTQITPVEMIGSTDPTFEGFSVNGFLGIDTSLAAFPSGVDGDICIESVTGIGDYFFNQKVLPRTTGELVLKGTGCPPAEEGPTMCSDTMDNDSDGFTDCADFSCQATDPACASTTTVSMVQMGTVTGTVTLNDVYVVSISKFGEHLWVADNLAAAAYEGVYVYRGSGAPDLGPEFVPGATVNVTGQVQEFDVNPIGGDTLTEISFAAVTFVAAPTGLPTALTGQTAATLGSIADGEPYEGVLVQLTDVQVTNDALGNGKVELTDNNGEIVVMDDDIFDYDMPTAPPIGTCYGTLTAISSIQLFDDIRTVAPRSAADMVIGVGCN